MFPYVSLPRFCCCTTVYSFFLGLGACIPIGWTLDCSNMYSNPHGSPMPCYSSRITRGGMSAIIMLLLLAQASFNDSRASRVSDLLKSCSSIGLIVIVSARL
ncbi:hypothetical protein BDV98DRAFT_567892, partial [Pterulicium gracile]